MHKILIVEDTQVLKIRLSKILRKYGFDDVGVLESKFFDEKYPEQVLKNADLFIVDLDIYGRDGVEVIKRIKGSDLSCDVKILGICKNPNMWMLKKAVTAGCTDLVIKPFNNEVFIHKIKKLFGEKEINEKSPNNVLAADVALEGDGFLKWDDSLKVDVKQIDDEHKSLIGAYEKLYHLMKNGKGHSYYNELLDFLNNYVQTHFENEQAIHAGCHYPLRFEHVEIHEEFKRSLAELHQGSHKNQVTDLELIKINLFIKNWLIHHILIEDRKFGEFYKQCKQK